MKPLRQFLRNLLDPRPPIWANSHTWTTVGILALLLALAADGAWRYSLLGVGFGLIIISGFVRFLQQSQMRWYRDQLIKRGSGLCPNCGYDLKGVNQLRCPECGTDVEAAVQEAAQMVRPER